MTEQKKEGQRKQSKIIYGEHLNVTRLDHMLL